MAQFKRRNKLPKPSLQLRLTLTFMGTLTLGIFLQQMLTRASLLRLALGLPHDNLIFMQGINTLQFEVLWVSLLVLLPLCFAVGVLSTFRVAGPLYRFEDHLRRIARGEDPGPCRIRKGDQLQELCGLLNDAVFALRARQASTPHSPSRQPEPPTLALPDKTEVQQSVEHGNG